jgi:hypothetical protein
MSSILQVQEQICTSSSVPAASQVLPDRWSEKAMLLPVAPKRKKKKAMVNGVEPAVCSPESESGHQKFKMGPPKSVSPFQVEQELRFNL